MSQVIGSFGFYLNGLNVAIANVTPTFFFSKIALQKYKYHPSKTENSKDHIWWKDTFNVKSLGLHSATQQIFEMRRK